MNEPVSMNTDGWRDQSPRADLLSDILARSSARRRSRRVLWLGITGSGLGIAGACLVVSLASAPVTLAQVIAADRKADSITIVNRRIMGPEKGGGFSVITRVVGSAMRVDVKFANGTSKDGRYYYYDRDGIEWFYPELGLIVKDLYSTHYPPADPHSRLRVADLLKDTKGAKVQKNFDWNGRKVNRWTYKATLRGTDIDEELLIDPTTDLPIRYLSMRDHGSWGDEWTYDYTKIDPATLKPEMPKQVEIIDHREKRTELEAMVRESKSTIPVVEFSPTMTAFFIKASQVPNGVFQAKVNFRQPNGSKHATTATVERFRPKHQTSTRSNPQWEIIQGERLRGDVRIAGQDLVMVRFYTTIDAWKQGWIGKTISGSLSFQGKTFDFSTTPVVRVGDVFRATDPYFKS